MFKRFMNIILNYYHCIIIGCLDSVLRICYWDRRVWNNYKINQFLVIIRTRPLTCAKFVLSYLPRQYLGLRLYLIAAKRVITQHLATSSEFDTIIYYNIASSRVVGENGVIPVTKAGTRVSPVIKIQIFYYRLH